jgi:hypothetical protein
MKQSFAGQYFDTIDDLFLGVEAFLGCFLRISDRAFLGMVTVCSVNKYTSSWSNCKMMIPSVTRSCAIGPGSSSWVGSNSETQENLTGPRFQCSASNSECTRGDATCLCSMHCRGHAHSYNNRTLSFGRSTRPEIPSLAMSAPFALR